MKQVLTPDCAEYVQAAIEEGYETDVLFILTENHQRIVESITIV